ncbi:DUF6339 family protein [Streptomyces sp. NPDC046261]|uniref:DUF6339 family protein n=1 Tax=Streptomyces sp. NPDC046261 TaxID=3157200 RepID=UPI0033CB26E6
MNSAEPGTAHDRIGRLPSSVALKTLTSGVLAGFEPMPEPRLRRSTEFPPEGARSREAEPIRLLCHEAMRRFRDETPTASDAWLAPRLHYALRITRVEAADSGLWNFLAMCVAPEFVRWRWGRPQEGDRREVGQAARYCGPWHSQCFSRLWWAAELFRDGADYKPVEIACRNQDILNTVLRQDLVLHRPAAQALVRLLGSGVTVTGRQVNGLAKLAYAASGTMIYEVLAPDEPQDADSLQDWIDAFDEALPAPDDRLPVGPDDGRVAERSTAALVKWFERLAEVAPVRGRKLLDEGTDVPRHGVSLDKPGVSP